MLGMIASLSLSTGPKLRLKPPITVLDLGSLKAILSSNFEFSNRAILE